MASSPMSSQLSELSSEDFQNDARRASPEGEADTMADNDSTAGVMPPSKRRKVARSKGWRAAPESPSIPAIHMNGNIDDESDVSSDTTGSVPGSPDTLAVALQGMEDEESLGSSQVRVCGWEGCNAGNLGNQDELVKHVHEEHVNNAKQAKYTCEWEGCKARQKPQMSAYALRAHMRSHTKEKPFYCALPECDKSFTRSDALAKHMRTVHETESLRTTENYAKRKEDFGFNRSGSPVEHTPPPDTPSVPTRPPKSLKLVFNTGKSSNTPPTLSSGEQRPSSIAAAMAEVGAGPVSSGPHSPLSPGTRDALFGAFASSLNFTPAEAALPRQDLYRLLRRQLHWAMQESERLADDVLATEQRRRKEWLARELLLENVMEAEFARAERRGLFDGRVVDDSLFGAVGSDSGSGAAAAADAGTAGDDPSAAAEPVDEATAAKQAASRQAKVAEAKALLQILEEDASVSDKLPVHGKEQPWYRGEEYMSSRQQARAERAERAKNGADEDDDVNMEDGTALNGSGRVKFDPGEEDAEDDDDDDGDSVLDGVQKTRPVAARPVVDEDDGGDTEIDDGA